MLINNIILDSIIHKILFIFIIEYIFTCFFLHILLISYLRTV